jgi:hypothetical protein
MVKAISLAAVAVAGAVLLVLIVLREDSGRADVPAVTRVEVRASLSAPEHRFGEPVDVRLDVLVPRNTVDVDSVRLDAPLTPFERVGPFRVQRFDGSKATLVRFGATLRCLARACVPIADTPLRIPDVAVRFRRMDGRTGVAHGVWPPVPSRSRLGGPADNLLAWHDGLQSLPALDYRVAPRVLAVLAGGIALACALAAALALAPPVGRLLPKRRDSDRRTLLERALAAVRRAAASGDTAERRRALDLLARELRAGARGREARVARRLAWSRRRPEGDEMQRLVDSVERGRA